MSNDLISRKELIEVLQPMLEAECTSYIAGMIIGKIKYFPTAYDIDKVVEQLTERADYEPIDFDCSGIACTEDDYFIALDIAIEIVKGNYSENPNSSKGGAK